MLRGEDDVKLELLSNDLDTERVGYNISYMAHNSGADITYQMEVELPVGAMLEELNVDNYETDGEVIRWTHIQSSGAAATSNLLVFNYNQVSGDTDVTPYVVSIKDDEEDGLVAKTKYPTMISGSSII